MSLMKKKTPAGYKEGMRHAGTWLPEDLYKKVKDLAKADDRSLALFMRRLIEKAVHEELTLRINNHNIGEN